MGNPYFQFKQFTVFHDLCAMKVGIDGVLLGAWANTDECRNVLDIGTGSGLIALMLAQRNPQARIEAIDLEENAIRQAEINFAASPWKERLTARHISLQEFAQTPTTRYELIVSNPPFFVNSLKAPAQERTHARHTDSLTHEELISNAQSLLAPQGRLCIILPVNEGEHCMDFAAHKGLHCTKRVDVYPKPGVPPKRLLLEFRSVECRTECSTLTIETDTWQQYTDEFIALARDFYLKL